MNKFVVIAILILSSLCFLLGFRLTGIGHYSWIIAGVITGLLLVYPFVWYDVLPPVLNKVTRAVTHFDMGLLSLTIIFLLLRDFIFVPVMLIKPGLFNVVFSGTATLLILVISLILLIFGYYHANAGPRVVQVNIPIAGLKPALEGYTILQISDLHAGPAINHNYVLNVLQMTSGLKVDLVTLTGDIADGKFSKYNDRAATLKQLCDLAPVLYIPGNHEYLHDSGQWFAFFKQMGFQLLFNEHTVIEKNGASILVAGVIDPEVKEINPHLQPDIQAAIDNSPVTDLKILLSHRPDMAKEAAAIFDLQLSGHTHAGQFFPWNLVIKVFQPLSNGLKRVGKMWVYTNPGTGFWGPPIRLGTTSEITVLKLVKA